MEPYTQANTKKTEIAKKMIQGLTMNGKSSGKGGGMIYPMNGYASSAARGQRVDMHGKDAKTGKSQKAPLANAGGNFIGKRFYTQHGEK